MAVYAEVAVNSYVTDSENNGIFDYIVPEAYEEIVRRGVRVVVPFGGRLVEGYVVNMKDNCQIPIGKLKSINDVPDLKPVFSENQLKLSEWMSEEYLCSIGECLKCILPPDAILKENKYLELNENPVKSEYRLKDADLHIINDLKDKGRLSLNELLKTYGKGAKSTISRLLRYNIVSLKSSMETRVRQKTVRTVELNIKAEDVVQIVMGLRKNKNNLKQADALEKISNLGCAITESELQKNYKISKSTIDTLVKKGLLKRIKTRVNRDPYADTSFESIDKPELTSEQQNVLNKILAEYYVYGKRNFLLHGITGSGKTEVYMRLIEHMIEKGRQSIVLVPEISLTPQTIEWFKGRFKRVAVLHSRLSNGERYDEWTKIKNGEADVVVGARSAVFAPVKKLGLLVIDEEHETSYKSDTTPKYNTKDVAFKRCEIENALLLLGSATPSIETYLEAQNGRFELCTMNSRIDGRNLPHIYTVDMREEMEQGNRTIFSRRLYNEIKNVLNTKKQAMLFINRRGYSTFVSCRKCGQAIKCPNCDVSLSYHSYTNELKCHYCGFSMKPPSLCPSCGSKYIKYFGLGTQKVENEVKRYFPDARILRMDHDTTSKKGSHDRIYKEFKSHMADILIGTQMIAKGLDFPEVTLVGIIAADTMLNIPDFRSAERSFQLITQVAGRAGRGTSPGRVVIQTYNPDHYSITSSVDYDFNYFFNKELKVRKAFNYPPFSDIVNIISSSRNENDAADALCDLTEKLKNKFNELNKNYDILGPTQAPISKINNYYRWQTIIKGKIDNDTKKIIKYTIDHTHLKCANTKISMDVNPVSLS